MDLRTTKQLLRKRQLLEIKLQTINHRIHTTTNTTLLERLADHDDVDIRLAVASNPHTPPTILNKLLEDSSKEVQDAALTALVDRENC